MLNKPDRIRTEHANILYNYINAVIPLINDRLLKGYKVKKDGSLFKQDRQDLRKILEENKTHKDIRAFINSGEYSTYLHFDINYPTGNFGCAYLKEDFFLYSNPYNKIFDEYTDKPFQPRDPAFPVTEHETINDIYNKVQVMDKERTDLKNKIDALCKDKRLFFDGYYK